MILDKKKVLVFFIIILFFSCVVWLYISLSYRNSIYKYNTQKDYIYEFPDTQAVIFETEIEGGRITLPLIPKDSFSCLLSINVKSTFWGHFLQPHLTLKNGITNSKHYFEHNVKGIRYLNISNVIEKGKTTLSLACSNVGILDSKIKILIFKNIDLHQKKILILAPHPDDAEIASYNLYSSEDSVYIVTTTAGEAGRKIYDELYENDSLHFFIKGKLRVWNSITTPILGGVKPENTFNLGYFDGTLKTLYLSGNSDIKSLKINSSKVETFRKLNVSTLIQNDSLNSSWNSLVNDYMFLLNKIKPDIIISPHPYLDDHPDHKFTTIALSEAIKNLKFETGKILLYTNHSSFTESYPFGEMGDPVSPAPYFSKHSLFRSIYSFPVDKEKQIEKLLALETMNDLRQDTEWMNLLGITEKAARKWFNFLRGKENSYFRRYVRSNELFYIIDVKDLKKLSANYLTEYIRDEKVLK